MGGFGDLDDFDEFMTFLEGDTKTFKMFFRDLGRGYSMGGPLRGNTRVRAAK